MNVSEKAAYLKGLIEGMNYDKDSNEGKLFAGILDLLEDLAMSVHDLEDENAMLNDYIEEIDEDLGEVEKDFYECEDDECDCDDCCDCCDDDCCEELECPACGEKIYIDSEEIDHMDKVVCPSCNAELDIVCNDDCCDDDCDCGCGDGE